MGFLGLDDSIQFLMLILMGVSVIVTPLTALLFKYGKEIAVLDNRMKNLEDYITSHKKDAKEDSDKLDEVDKDIAVLKSRFTKDAVNGNHYRSVKNEEL